MRNRTLAGVFPTRVRAHPRLRPGAPTKRTHSPPKSLPGGDALADLLSRVYQVDPPVGPRCAAPIRVVSFNTKPAVIRHILDHIESLGFLRER